MAKGLYTKVFHICQSYTCYINPIFSLYALVFAFVTSYFLEFIHIMEFRALGLHRIQCLFTKVHIEKK